MLKLHVVRRLISLATFGISNTILPVLAKSFIVPVRKAPITDFNIGIIPIRLANVDRVRESMITRRPNTVFDIPYQHLQSLIYLSSLGHLDSS